MRILITGGAGFIGSHVAEAYLKRGHTVDIIDDLSMGYVENIPVGATFHNIDVTSDACTELIMHGGYDAINHHAAHMELRVSVEKPVHDATINILGSLRIFEAARRAGVPHVIAASTTAVLGEFVNLPADETHPVLPIAPYGVSKRAMEIYAEYERMVHGLSLTILRYTNVYGPRQNPHGESGVIAIFLEKFLRNEVPTIHGDGSQERDYIHVDDVASANVLALEQRPQGTYHICRNGAASVNDVVAALRNALGNDYAVHHGPAKPGDPPKTRGSHQLFTQTTGWAPTVDLQEGISSTAAWFTSRR